MIAVKPNGTQLLIGFYDRRADSNNGLRHAYGRIADISGVNVTFRPSFRVSASNFRVVDPFLEGDYDTASADNTYFYYAWGDNRDIIGGTTPLYEANIRFTRIYSP